MTDDALVERPKTRWPVICLALALTAGLAYVLNVLGLRPPAESVTASPERTGPRAAEFRELNDRSRRVAEMLLLEFEERLAILQEIDTNWDDEYTPLLIETMQLNREPVAREKLVRVLENHTGQHYGDDSHEWLRWQWQQEPPAGEEYVRFKREVYRDIDQRFAEYFDPEYATTIRLDEIRWGGVRQDGIPPLKDPEVISANQADYLADTDVVFGVSFQGHARAYPKRILAWHEMVKDTVGEQPINGVYCTLCGSMIVYDPRFERTHYELGTSGFLYRSNKLMYDHDTKSMWSTLRGEPVVGPLVGAGIRLKPLHVVTTTWQEWKRRHPHTDVLSLNTGHDRDYGEGVAYREYFATDNLMFPVPQTDERLKNKDEVLIVRQASQTPVAISVDFLNEHRIYRTTVGDTDVVVVTDLSGANRIYEAPDNSLTGWIDETTLVSADEIHWTVTEASLTPVDAPNKKPLLRLPAHRAFWFGWHAAFPDTKLISANNANISEGA